MMYQKGKGFAQPQLSDWRHIGGGGTNNIDKMTIANLVLW